MLGTLLQDDAPPPTLAFQLDWPRLDQGGSDAIEEWLDANPAARLIVVHTIARVRPPRKGKRGPIPRSSNYIVDRCLTTSLTLF
jgi:hypothetical protein